MNILLIPYSTLVVSKIQETIEEIQTALFTINNKIVLEFLYEQYSNFRNYYFKEQI